MKSIKLPQNLFDIITYIINTIKKTKENLGKIWLVGGTVRDILLGHNEITDIDLVCEKNPITLLKQISLQEHLGFFVLDHEREIARIVKQYNGKFYTIDFAKLKASDITNDLYQRDFTINAISAYIDWPLLDNEIPLYDPLNGIKDLHTQKLVECNKSIFIDDPLRILRVFRFFATLNFKISESLFQLIHQNVHLIKNIAFERIRDEFFKILSTPNSYKTIKYMDEVGIIKEILPELEAAKNVTQNEWHHLDVFNHSLKTLENFENLLNSDIPLPIKYWNKVNEYLNSFISGSRKYLEIYKFACLLHDIAKPNCKKVLCNKDSKKEKVTFYGHEIEGMQMVKNIGIRWKLSNQEIDCLQITLKNHMRPGVILQEVESKPNELKEKHYQKLLFRYFMETGREGVGIALLSLADRLAAQGNIIDNMNDALNNFKHGIYNIIDSFYSQLESYKQPPILNGNDLITIFRLKPGPHFKTILDALKEAQTLQNIKTKEEAVTFVSNFIQQNSNIIKFN